MKYETHLIDIFFIWKGGLAFYGGMILAIIASSVFIRKNKMPFCKTADLIVPYVALGHSIGRIGCFLNGCCYGKPVQESFLSVLFPGQTLHRHPTELYASLALLAIFVILKVVERKTHFDGFIIGLYLILYSIQRFFIDFLRGDTPRYILDLTTSQLISITLFITIICFMLLRRKFSHGKINL